VISKCQFCEVLAKENTQAFSLFDRLNVPTFNVHQAKGQLARVASVKCEMCING
jgi:hypothetical protein